MSEFDNLPDQLFKELSEFYIKYINTKQSDNILEGQDANKFNLLFWQIEKIISDVVKDTLLTQPKLCSGYQTRYKEFFSKELAQAELNSSTILFFNLKKQLIEFMLKVIEKTQPNQLPTYRTFSLDSKECGSGYQIVFLQLLNKIKEQIKNNTVPLIYKELKEVTINEIDEIENYITNENNQINQVNQINQNNQINQINQINQNNQINQIENILNEKEDVSPDSINSDYIMNELIEKYNEFLNINTVNFNKKIKNKIKKSIIQIILIESKIKKIYNTKKEFIFTKAFDEFFNKV